MEIAQELSELAALPSDAARPVLSLYLDSRWRDEQQRRRVRLFVRERCRALSAANGALRETSRQVEARAERLIDEDSDAPGFALFASRPRGLWKELRSRLPFEPSLQTAPEPRLLPLAAVSGLRAPLLLGVISLQGAAIYESLLGDRAQRLDLALHYERHTQMRGYWQRSGEHRPLRQRELNQKWVAELLTRFWDRRPSSLLLAGPETEVAELEGHLPPRVRERLLPRLVHPTPLPESELLARALERADDWAKADQQQRADRLVAAALGGQAAALGPEDVILAAEEGQVWRLFVERGLSLPGWSCLRCGAAGVKIAERCVCCDGPTREVELCEELCRRVIRGSGEVRVIDGDARLHHFAGLVAELRHRVPI